MASTFTPNINLEEPGNGDYSDTWNLPLNSDLTIIDQALGAFTTQAFTNVDVVFTAAQGAYYEVRCTGVLSGNVSLIFPSTVGGRRIINNGCTGSFTLTVKNGAGDTGVVVAQGVRTPISLTQGAAAIDNYASTATGTASIASAATTDLGSVPQGNITITGTTAITSFGSSAPTGAIRFLTFSGILTLTYNATSLVVPSAANITTAAADTAVAEHKGSGNWVVLVYQRASGLALVVGAGVASFNGRQNAVIPATDDYTTAELTTANTATPPSSGRLGETLTSSGTISNVGPSPQTNVASINLTAGHWLCFASLSIVNSSQPTTSVGGSISLNSGALGAGSFALSGFTIPAGNTVAFSPPPLVVRTAGQVVYLGGYNGSVGAATATGTLTALRID